MPDPRRNPDPLVTAFYARAFANSITVTQVLRHAGLGGSVWTRLKAGGDFRITTLNKLNRALDEMIAEQNGAPAAPSPVGEANG